MHSTKIEVTLFLDRHRFGAMSLPEEIAMATKKKATKKKVAKKKPAAKKKKK